MELTYGELKKRDVVNVSDGSSFGHICDVSLDFPSGKLSAIVVPAKRGGGFFGLFSRGKITIEQRNIIKIGGDVILVNVKCGDTCSSSVSINPLCPPPPPPRAVEPREENGQNFYGNERIDLSDY